MCHLRFLAFSLHYAQYKIQQNHTYIQTTNSTLYSSFSIHEYTAHSTDRGIDAIVSYKDILPENFYPNCMIQYTKMKTFIIVSDTVFLFICLCVVRFARICDSVSLCIHIHSNGCVQRDFRTTEPKTNNRKNSEINKNQMIC